MSAPPLQEKTEAVLNLWALDKTLTAIGEQFGVSRSVIAGIINRARTRGDERAAYKDKSKLARKRGVKMSPLSKGRVYRKPVPKPIRKAKPMDYPVPEKQVAHTSFRDGGGMTFMELPFTGACKWPVGDPRQESFQYCGADADEGRVYCCHHYRLSCGPGTPSERKAPRTLLRMAA